MRGVTRRTASRVLGLCFGMTLGAGAALVGGCEQFCGPCGSIEIGQLDISVVPWVDYHYLATHRLARAFDRTREEFDASALALAWTYGALDRGERVTVDVDLIRALEQVIDADVAEHVEGGLAVLYTPPRCHADAAGAFAAQTLCELERGCGVATPNEPEFARCLGRCEGACLGECSGDDACELDSAGACGGLCAGSCVFSAPAPCEGVCRGECAGVCTRFDAEGACAGACEGTCAGLCELPTPEFCAGDCYGDCLVDANAPGCDGEQRCRGECDGLCAGVCRGPLEARRLASARCEDQDAVERCLIVSSHLAAVGLRCSPPTLELQYVFRDTIEESDRAAFMNRIAALERHGAVALQGAARLRALVSGELEGEPLFPTSPYNALQERLLELIRRGFDFPGVAKGRIVCVIPAFEEALMVLTDYAPEVAALRDAQDEFTGIFGIE